MNICKHIFFGVFLTLFATIPLSVQAADHSMHDMGSMNHSSMSHEEMNHGDMSHPAIYTTKGKVISIDKEAKKIEIAHEAVPCLNWPSMTMRFIVNDLSLFDDITSGDTVSFDFSQSDKDYVIVDIYPQ